MKLCLSSQHYYHQFYHFLAIYRSGKSMQITGFVELESSCFCRIWSINADGT